MNLAHCPICFTPLDTVDVAPCHDCGHLPEELDHFSKGLHTYADVEVFDGLSLVLCNFCQVDFRSYDLAYFGENARLSTDYLKGLVRLEGLSISKDKFCSSCNHRLAFLEFVAKAREKFRGTTA